MKFLKPNLAKLILFIMLVFLSIYAIYNARIFSCKVQPVVLNPPEFQDSSCLPPFFMNIVGVNIIYYPSAYVLSFILLFLIPYLTACFIDFLLDQCRKL